MKANVVGDLLADNIFCYEKLTVGTTPIVLGPVSLSNLDGCSFQLINEANGGSNVTGTWKIEVSNNYTDTSLPSLNQNGARFPAKWTDITSQFSPTITDPSGSPLSQYVQAYPLVAGSIRVTFTPVSGTGLITVLYFAKGNR